MDKAILMWTQKDAKGNSVALGKENTSVGGFKSGQLWEGKNGQEDRRQGMLSEFYSGIVTLEGMCLHGLLKRQLYPFLILSVSVVYFF